MSEKSLKPCPFCGGAGKIRVEFSARQESWYFSVRCVQCYASSRTFKTIIDPFEYPELLDKAISKWNRRVDEE